MGDVRCVSLEGELCVIPLPGLHRNLDETTSIDTSVADAYQVSILRKYIMFLTLLIDFIPSLWTSFQCQWTLSLSQLDQPSEVPCTQ
jgi:hypothetical protein